MTCYWKVRISFIEVSVNVFGYVWFVYFVLLILVWLVFVVFFPLVLVWRQDSGLETV